MNRTVLISGGGVAGLALAHWLQREGFSTTVIERSPELRSGGQAVDIRGVALDVVKAMGLHEAVAARRTRLRGMSIVDADGREIDRTEERTFSAGRLDSDDIEIFRDDLCGLLLNQAGESVEYIYGDSITAIQQDADIATVSFRGQSDRCFDFVIGADGVYSNVRKLVFGNDASFVKPLGVTMALFTTPNLIDLQSWQLAYREEAIGYVIYPSFDQTQLRVGVGFGHGCGEMQTSWRLFPAVARRHARYVAVLLGRAGTDPYVGLVAGARRAGWRCWLLRVAVFGSGYKLGAGWGVGIGQGNGAKP